MDHVVFASDVPFEPKPGLYIRETIRCIEGLDISAADKTENLRGQRPASFEAVVERRRYEAICGSFLLLTGAGLAGRHLRKPCVACAAGHYHNAGAASGGRRVHAAGRAAAGPPPEVSYKDLPAFCRVAATLKPTSDSDIKMEVWLPASGWNRKFQAVGNGGWAGVISYSAMAEALHDGYATSSTDTGHVGGTGNFALGHPEKLVDFGYRAVHEMTLKAKSASTRSTALLPACPIGMDVPPEGGKA